MSIAKPTKATGTSWTEHKINAMNIALVNYCAFPSHIQSLSHTDSNTTKREELKGYFNKWKDFIPCLLLDLPGYPSSHTPFKPKFSARPARVVKPIRRIRDFSWTMMKLRAFRNKSLNEPISKLNHYKRVILTGRPKPLMQMFLPFEYIFFLQLNCVEVWYF